MSHMNWSICTRLLTALRNDLVRFLACCCRFGVATVSRLLKIIGLFCKRALYKRRYYAQETYNFKEPTNRSHPILAFAETCQLFPKEDSLSEWERVCVVMCCKVLQSAAVCCNVCTTLPILGCTATHFITLQHTATHCNTLFHTMKLRCLFFQQEDSILERADASSNFQTYYVQTFLTWCK